ncbi:MAG: M55 family metallopeptidase [Anaerolineae bacterium]
MKVYIMADQEGVACVFSRKERYVHAKEYATIELVAICEAMLKNGVGEILLNSVHEIEYHELPKQVQVLHGLDRHDLFTEGLDETFAAVMIVGMHEMAGGRERGCWRHTILPHPITYAYSSVEAVWLNDTLVGETGLTAAFAGIYGVPVVLLTGDHWACLEAQDLLPGVETVAVKKGTSYFSAISMTPAAAAEASAQGAVRALAKLGTIRPWRLEGAVTLKVRYQFAERATEAVQGVPEAVRVDERTVAVIYESIAALRDNLGCLRTPEEAVFQRDTGFRHTTGLFTRTGGEPYESRVTYPLSQS